MRARPVMVGRQRQRRHGRAEIGAADADIDDVGERARRAPARSSPERTPSAKRDMRSSTALTSGITFLPSTRIGRFERLRSATCSTARFSVN